MTAQTRAKIPLKQIARGNQSWTRSATVWRLDGIRFALERMRKGKAMLKNAQEIHVHARNLDFLLKCQDQPGSIPGIAEMGDLMLCQALPLSEVNSLAQAIQEIEIALNRLRRGNLRWWNAQRIELVAMRATLIAESLENKPDIGA
jgi:hypothetical protein